jgi:hypothetical protein
LPLEPDSYEIQIAVEVGGDETKDGNVFGDGAPFTYTTPTDGICNDGTVDHVASQASMNCEVDMGTLFEFTNMKDDHIHFQVKACYDGVCGSWVESSNATHQASYPLDSPPVTNWRETRTIGGGINEASITIKWPTYQTGTDDVEQGWSPITSYTIHIGTVDHSVDPATTWTETETGSVA